MKRTAKRPRNAGIIYKYNVPANLYRTQSGRKSTVLIALILIVAAFWFHPALGVFTLIASIVIASKEYTERNRIILTAQYLILGDHVIYFRSISDTIDNSGQFLMKTSGGEQFAIEESKFPTNARKDWKIKKNREAKFKKVTAKLKQFIEKAKASGPDEGISQ